MRSIYDNVSKATSSVTIAPQNATASVTITGGFVDTQGYNTGVLRVFAAGTSAINSATLVVTLQECSTSGGTYTTARDNTGATIGFTITPNGVAAFGDARIEGLGLNRLRYLQAVIAPTYTVGSGAGNQAPVMAEILMGRAYTLPTNSAVSNT